MSKEKCIEEAKIANAHNFIMNLPSQYDYKLGEAELDCLEDSFKD